MAEEIKRLNITLEASLHKELKVTAAREEVTITQFVAEAIREKIERENKKL